MYHQEEIIFYATTLIWRAIETDGVTMDELTEIVLNVDDNRSWCYYFVDHKHRLLFWVEPVNMQEGLGTDLDISEYSHISAFGVPLLSFTDMHLEYLVETRYWYASGCL